MEHKMRKIGTYEFDYENFREKEKRPPLSRGLFKWHFAEAKIIAD